MTNTQQKIVPHLWLDQEAKAAAEFFFDVFGGDSQVKNITTLQTRHRGIVTSFHRGSWARFRGHQRGPLFKFNPSVSFILNFDPSKDKRARENLDALWGKLSQGGTALMPLDKYPFSERYGWIKDKYGLSWQLILSDPEGNSGLPRSLSHVRRGGVRQGGRGKQLLLIGI